MSRGNGAGGKRLQSHRCEWIRHGPTTGAELRAEIEVRLMPYVRKFRRRGVGDAASCPSMEQLMGIQDSNDPCQNLVASLPSGLSPSTLALVNTIPGTSTSAPTSMVGPIQPGQSAASYANAMYVPPASTASSITSFLQEYQMPLLIAGIALFGLAILRGGR